MVLGALAALGTGSLVLYKTVANHADIRTEQANVLALAQRADRIHGATGSYQGLTTSSAVGMKIPPVSMVAGSGLMSRWSMPVLLAPAAIGSKPNAGLKITYQSVPQRACARFVQAAGQGMYDIEVGGQSVFSHRPAPSNDPLRLELDLLLVRCAPTATPVAFIYNSGATGLSATVLTPVCTQYPSMCAGTPPSSPPPTAPPPSPPPVAPPSSPPAPGCGAAPTAPATGTTPAGQACSFIWTTAPAPSCWAPLALCAPIVVPPPVAPPPSVPPPPGTPPVSPPPSAPFCTVPSPAISTENTSGACPAGQVTTSGATSFPQSRTRTVSYSCPDPFGAVQAAPATYTPWSPTVGSVCFPACVAPAPSTQTQAGTPQSMSTPYSAAGTPQTGAGTPETRRVDCAPGQTGDIFQTRTTTITRSTTTTRTGTQSRSTTQTRPVSYACPAPTGSYTTTPGTWSAPGAPYGAWGAEIYTPWTAPAAPYGAWSPPGGPNGGWATTSNTCVDPPPPPPVYASCDAMDRTEIPGTGLGAPPNRACTAATIGMRAVSTYISCGSNNMCGGTGNLAECQPAGWKIICGAGSAPYTPCVSPMGPGWQELGSQGTQDYLDRTYGSGPSRYFTSYSCPGTAGTRGDWRPVHYGNYDDHQTQPFFIRAEPGPAVPAACLVPPIDTSTNPLAKIVWRIQVTPDCPCTSANFGARMTRGAAVDQNGASSDGKEMYYESTFTCTTAWSSF